MQAKRHGESSAKLHNLKREVIPAIPWRESMLAFVDARQTTSGMTENRSFPQSPGGNPAISLTFRIPFSRE